MAVSHKLLTVIFLGLSLSSCAALYKPQIRYSVDEITGNNITIISNFCNTICITFKVINKNEGYAYITLHRENWLFVESISLKVLNSEKEPITLKQEVFRNIKDSGSISEKMAVPITRELYDFFDSARGNGFLARFTGDEYFQDVKRGAAKNQGGLFDELILNMNRPEK